MTNIGKFCEIYGDSIRMRVLEALLESSDIEIEVKSMAEFLEISKPKVYEIMYSFLEKGWVVKTRVIGKTQLYQLDKKHPIVKIFMRNFKECLQMVVDEHTVKVKR